MSKFPFETGAELAGKLSSRGVGRTVEHDGSTFEVVEREDARGYDEITFRHEETGRFFYVSYPYDSWAGSSTEYAEWQEVRPVEKTITVYEVVR